MAQCYLGHIWPELSSLTFPCLRSPTLHSPTSLLIWGRKHHTWIQLCVRLNSGFPCPSKKACNETNYPVSSNSLTEPNIRDISNKIQFMMARSTNMDSPEMDGHMTKDARDSRAWCGNCSAYYSLCWNEGIAIRKSGMWDGAVIFSLFQMILCKKWGSKNDMAMPQLQTVKWFSNLSMLWADWPFLFLATSEVWTISF